VDLTPSHTLADIHGHRRPGALALTNVRADLAGGVNGGLADGTKGSLITESEGNCLVLAGEGVEDSVESDLSSGLTNRAEVNALLRKDRVGSSVVAVSRRVIKNRGKRRLSQPRSDLEAGEGGGSRSVDWNEGLIRHDGSKFLTRVGEDRGLVRGAQRLRSDASVSPRASHAIVGSSLQPRVTGRIRSVSVEGLIHEATSLINHVLHHAVLINSKVGVVELNDAVDAHSGARVLLSSPRRSGADVDELERARESEVAHGGKRALASEEEVSRSPTRRELSDALLFCRGQSDN